MHPSVKTILRRVHFMFSSIKTLVFNTFTILLAITSLTCAVYRSLETRRTRMNDICESILCCLCTFKRCICFILRKVGQFLCFIGDSILKLLIAGYNQLLMWYRGNQGYRRLHSDDIDKLRTLQDLKKRRQELQKRIIQRQQMQLWLELSEKREQCLRTLEQRLLADAIQKFTNKLLDKKMSNYLRSCLHCGNADSNMSTVPPKELYRIYGLLLSACCIKKESNSTLDTMQMSVVKKVLSAVTRSYSDETDIKLRQHVITAVTLSLNMLTLIPPLLAEETYCFDEYQHNTFRKTWDETKESDQPLYYYRPILVYGLSQNIAVKGLVANCEQEIDLIQF